MCTFDWSAAGAWLAAIATSAIAFLTWRTLLKLRDYADDTRRMADHTDDQLKALREQAEASIRPAIVVGFSINQAKADAETLYMRNSGNGLALNLAWNQVWEGRASTEHLASLSTGGEEWYAGSAKTILQSMDGKLLIMYTSLSGHPYETLITITQDPKSGQRKIHTDIKKLNPP